MQKQKTLAASFSLKGKGLHTGLDIEITFNPAPENHGYKIKRVDMEGQPTIDALAENVVNTQRGTVLSKNGVQVSTIEHAMAALYAYEIDNCLIEVNAPEFPILDGSSRFFSEEIQKTGVVEQNAPKDYYIVKHKIEVKDEETGSSLIILPDDKFSVNVLISFDSPVLSNQFATLNDLSEFPTELAGFDTLKQQPSYERKPIYYALSAVYGIYAANGVQIANAFESLKGFYPKDAVTHTMYELGKRFGSNLKDFALQMNIIYKEKNLDMRSIYYGPSLARELYVYVGFVTGSLRSIQEELEAKLVVETHTSNGILQALALSNIYSNDFEKAFAIYNSLLDDLGEGDSQTRFLAAIAAMGANRHENAVALLQLAKIESATNFEARYALGLLYQEGKNMKAAIQHYDKISHTGFESEFFDFEIDTSELLNPQKDDEKEG